MMLLLVQLDHNLLLMLRALRLSRIGLVLFGQLTNLYLCPNSEFSFWPKSPKYQMELRKGSSIESAMHLANIIVINAEQNNLPGDRCALS